MSTVVRAELAELVDQIDAMVASVYDGAARRVVDGGPTDPADWRRVGAEYGLVGLHLPASLGGQDQPFACTAAVAASLGRRLAPAPFQPVLGAAVRLLAEASVDQRDRLLPDALSGASVVAVAGLETGLDGPRPRVDVAEGHATGTLSAVPHADEADLLLVVTSADVLVVDRRADGVEVTPRETLDLLRPRAQVVLDRAAVERLDVAPGAVDDAVLEATVLLAVEDVAGAETCLTAALDHARLRTQFGRPIGSFQALQHALADLFADVVSARAAVDLAVDAIDGSDDRASVEESARVAAVAASEAYRRAARDSVHVHGGIGFTWEHDAHLHLRRALGDWALLGDPSSHRRALGRGIVASVS